MRLDRPQRKPKRPLTPWELPSLLTPLHMLRRIKHKRARHRPHHAAILSFIYRNRFVVSSQVQRRFSQFLGSDRTTRRHLEEMQQLRLLDIVPTRNTSPLFPKVYYVTGRGVRQLRQAYAAQGKTWNSSRVERKGQHRKEGYGAEQVLHEILLTEFLLALWQTVQGRPDLMLLTIQRRSLSKHPAFQLSIDNRTTQLKPDALFLFRQNDCGMLICCVEMDTGSMNRKQIRAKFARYAAWSQSAPGQQYLVNLYQRHGAKDPRPIFRLLMIARNRSGTDDNARLADLLTATKQVVVEMRKRIWLTTVAALREHQHDERPLTAPIWKRISDLERSASRRTVEQFDNALRQSLFF